MKVFDKFVTRPEISLKNNIDILSQTHLAS